MKNSPVRVMLIGAAGRMGKTIRVVAQNDPDIEIAALCDLGDSIERAMKSCDVTIDFSQPGIIDEICRAALQNGKSLVIGTTGHSQQQRKTIEEAAHSLPIPSTRMRVKPATADAARTGAAGRHTSALTHSAASAPLCSPV